MRPARPRSSCGPTWKKSIQFIAQRADTIDATHGRIHLANGDVVDYDYLVIATGPRLAFDLVPGAGPEGWHMESVCTVEHAERAYAHHLEFLKNPDPVVIGALPGASCFGPAYEYAMALETDLRRRKLRHKVPITYVSSEPYVGHLGLGDVGDSKGLLEVEFRQRHIKWITNAKTTRVEAGKMHVEEVDDFGEKVREHTVDFRYAMMLPPFHGVAAVAAVEGLCNPGGFVIVDEYQRSPRYPNIYSAGECIAFRRSSRHRSPPARPRPVT